MTTKRHDSRGALCLSSSVLSNCLETGNQLRTKSLLPRTDEWQHQSPEPPTAAAHRDVARWWGREETGFELGRGIVPKSAARMRRPTPRIKQRSLCCRSVRSKRRPDVAPLACFRSIKMTTASGFTERHCSMACIPKAPAARGKTVTSKNPIRPPPSGGYQPSFEFGCCGRRGALLRTLPRRRKEQIPDRGRPVRGRAREDIGHEQPERSDAGLSETGVPRASSVPAGGIRRDVPGRLHGNLGGTGHDSFGYERNCRSKEVAASIAWWGDDRIRLCRRGESWKHAAIQGSARCACWL
jgi:hypothetical protein